MKSLDKNKVVLGMSGGVDSSVAACLFQRQGLEVFGVSMQLYSCHRPLAKGCCTPADRMDAREVCERLGISFDVLDLRSEFKKIVMQYFADEYSKGRTPLPCTPCNKEIRLKALLEYADRVGAYWIATGHYARVKENSDQSFSLLHAKNLKKDQSYFLWGLEQSDLSRLKFPIGEFETKEEVRAIARACQLVTSEKKDSQEVCFVGDQDYASFLEEHFPDSTYASGAFVNKDGEVLGRHRGLHAYTIGQRRGLGVAIGKRQYVVALNADSNEVVLGERNSLRAQGLVATSFHFLSKYEEREPVLVKIRSTHAGVQSSLSIEDEMLKIQFEKPQEAITPGQAAVFYRGEELLGGGWIEKAIV